MAIKISGTTVIDDSGNFTNIANTTATTLIGDGSQLTGVSKAADIVTPLNESPADGAALLGDTPTLEVSRFISLQDRTHANTQFQVSIDSGFSNTEVDIFTGANTTVVVPASLDNGTEHFFRARFIDSEGCCSDFSSSTSFTPGVEYAEFVGASFGTSAGGGFYMGTICAASTCYYLVMAPNATGCVCGCRWKNTRTTTGVTGAVDGYLHTYSFMTTAAHPAGNWTRTRVINDFSDWYLPAKNEWLCVYNNKDCAPAGEDFETLYWTSTEVGGAGAPFDACRMNMTTGGVTSNGDKFNCTDQSVRAFRRVAFPS